MVVAAAAAVSPVSLSWRCCGLLSPAEWDRQTEPIVVAVIIYLTHFGACVSLMVRYLGYLVRLYMP